MSLFNSVTTLLILGWLSYHQTDPTSWFEDGPVHCANIYLIHNVHGTLLVICHSARTNKVVCVTLCTVIQVTVHSARTNKVVCVTLYMVIQATGVLSHVKVS